MNIEVLVELQTPNFLIEVSKGIQGTNGVGVPIGGTTGQVLVKNSNADYDTEWVDPAGGNVDSVNGQTGVVVLDATDVGADAAGTASNAISSHVAEVDPHPQYATDTDLANGLAIKQNSLGFTPENVANKSQNTSLGISNTLYPTQNAVKTYVDAATKTQTDTFLISGTWTKQAGAKRVRGICISGTGGGGSGRRGAAGSVRCGGGSGASGYYVLFDLDASLLPSTVSVTVGAAGIGGASVTTDNTNGNSGTSGGSSSFGTFARTTTAAGGVGGTASSGAGGTAQVTTSSPMASRQISGIAASTTGGNGAGGSWIITLEGTSGGAGAGIMAANNPQAGGSGGGYTANSPMGLVSGGTAGTTAGTSGGDGNLTPYYLYGLQIGTSGGGGGTVGSGTIAGNGGNSGGYLGSGGGGAASTNGTPSGKGGDGFSGAVVVITEF